MHPFSAFYRRSTCLARSSEQSAKLSSARAETLHCVIQDSLWNFLPPDTLALVASHLKPRYIAAARETCKAWRHGISRGVITLAPNVQSPSGGRIGSVASYYLYAALRWQDMPMLLVSFIAFAIQDTRKFSSLFHSAAAANVHDTTILPLLSMQSWFH